MDIDKAFEELYESWAVEFNEEVAAHARVMAKKGDSAKAIKKMHPEITDDELENLIKESHDYPSDEYTEYMQNETPGEKVGKFKEWEAAAEKGYVDEVAPPGWEKTVKKMKKNKEIDNPWALAWYMKNQGAKPQAEEVELQEGRPAISPDEEERRIGMQPGDKEKGQLKQKLQNVKWTETGIESYLRKKGVKYTEIISQDEDQRLDRGQFIIKLANGIVLDYNNRIARDDTLIRGNVKKINKKALKNYIDTYEPMYSRIQDIYGRGSGKEYMVVGFNPAVDIVAEEFLGEAAPANKTGGNIEGPELPLRKKKKKVEMSKFAGKDVFMVDSKYFYNARLGKNRYSRYEKYVGNDVVGEAIRQFGRANPDKPIILANREDGSMMYLKYGRNNPSLSGQ